MVQMTSILWPNCYLGRVSPLFIPQIGVILLPFFALAMWGLSTSLSIWSSKSDPHHHGYPSYAKGRGTIYPLVAFTSFSYVCLSFLRLRWPDETFLRVLLALTIVITIVFFLLSRYLLYPPLPLALAIDVCLAGLMLIVAAPVDLVLELMLIVANPQTPISISLKCWWFSSLKP